MKIHPSEYTLRIRQRVDYYLLTKQIRLPEPPYFLLLYYERTASVNDARALVGLSDVKHCK